MANPLHNFASDNADLNLAAGATIFSQAGGSLNRLVLLDISIGDGTKNLNGTGETTLTFQVSRGGVLTDQIEVAVPAGQVRFKKHTGPILWLGFETLALTCQSSNAADIDVDVSVRAFDAAPLQPDNSSMVLAIEAGNRAHADLRTMIGTPLSESTAGNLANNFKAFWDNKNSAPTTKVVDDVGAAAEAQFLVNVMPSIVHGGEVQSGPLIAYVNAGDTRTLVISDHEGQPVDLSAASLRFVVENTTDGSDLFVKTTTGGGLTVGGAGNNQVTLAYVAADVATLGQYRYALRDATTGKVWAEGPFSVRVAAE